MCQRSERMGPPDVRHSTIAACAAPNQHFFFSDKRTSLPNFSPGGSSNRSMAEKLRFENYELNPLTGELRRNGGIVPLQRQPALALVLLASRRGELVTRRELRSAIWPDGTHVDFNRGLNFCIRQVRAALDDTARQPRFVETVARQGYRFIARADVERGSRRLTFRDLAYPRRYAKAGLSAGLAVAGIAVVALTPMRRSTPHPAEHHRAAASFVRSVHDAVFGSEASGPHHEAARRAAVALHDLFY
jgi:DNA-binding winged helix-turn-helix (wHTH) protein